MNNHEPQTAKYCILQLLLYKNKLEIVNKGILLDGSNYPMLETHLLREEPGLQRLLGIQVIQTLDNRT